MISENMFYLLASLTPVSVWIFWLVFRCRHDWIKDGDMNREPKYFVDEDGLDNGICHYEIHQRFRCGKCGKTTILAERCK